MAQNHDSLRSGMNSANPSYNLVCPSLHVSQSLSSQSLTTFPSLLHQHSTPLKTTTHPTMPLANSTLLNHSLLNGSTSSLSSAKSTQSARELTTQPQSLLGSHKPPLYTNPFSAPSAPRVAYHSQSAYPLKPSSMGSSSSLLAHKPTHKPGSRRSGGGTYARENGRTPALRFGSGSSSGSGEGTSLELERAKAKIRQLGKEVKSRPNLAKIQPIRWQHLVARQEVKPLIYYSLVIHDLSLYF